MNTIAIKTVAARKPHTCDECLCVIPKGEAHRAETIRDGRQIWTWRACACCVEWLRVGALVQGPSWPGERMRGNLPEFAADLEGVVPQAQHVLLLALCELDRRLPALRWTVAGSVLVAAHVPWRTESDAGARFMGGLAVAIAGGNATAVATRAGSQDVVQSHPDAVDAVMIALSRCRHWLETT
jgi:hypothetical protein